MPLTRLNRTLLVLVVIGGVVGFVALQRREAKLHEEMQSLCQRLAQLQEANQTLSKQLTLAQRARAPRLSVPTRPINLPTSAAAREDLPTTNLYDRFKAQAPKLSVEQLGAYLKANGRSAVSLLAAYRTSGDPALLREAMEKYPQEPQVAFEAAMGKDVPPDQRRAWLQALQQAAPENALPSYLLARDYLQAGQMDQALQALTAAYTKPQFQDYTLERVQNDQEVYLSAGYSPPEAERIALSWLELPQLAQLKNLGVSLVALANNYQQSGDADSAQAALQMTLHLGERYADGPPEAALISQLVGLAVERMALGAMDPNSPFPGTGQTAQERLAQLAQQTTTIRDLAQRAEPLLPTLSDQEVALYQQRRLLFGEIEAMRWLVAKYGP